MVEPRFDRDYLPEIGWPVYDLRRRRFGICIGGTIIDNEEYAKVHIEGDRYPVTISPEMPEYEYPAFYINDQVTWKGEDGYYIKHVHYHVPKNVWQYTIAKEGIAGFDRFVVEGGNDLELVKRYVSPI